MSYVRGLSLPRRTLLRGLGGAALSVPFLSAMAPAARAQALPSAQRFAFIYFPNGYIRDTWTPKEEGRGYALTPSLASLAKHKARFSVLTGLADDPSKTTSGFHDRALASILTGVEMSKSEVRVGPSIDQIAAPYLSKDTPLSSLEVAVEELTVWGSPVYKTATNQLPMEINPRAVFERLFGDADSLDPAALAALRDQQKSMLDLVTGSAADLKKSLGAADRVKLDQYLDSVREIEHKIALSEKLSAKKINIARPLGPPRIYSEYVKLMMDLQVAAFQADITRVSSLSIGQEASNMDFNEIDWPYSHHLTSHHQNVPEKVNAMSKINAFQVSMFSYFLDRMQAVEDGDGTLLDHTASLYFSSLGDANRHMQVDLPVLLAGGTSMGFKHGRHLKLPDHTPITNLYVTMLDRAKIPVAKMGDSTGVLSALTEA